MDIINTTNTTNTSNTSILLNKIQNTLFNYANHCIFKNITDLSYEYDENNSITPITMMSNKWEPQTVINDFCTKYSNITPVIVNDCFITNKQYENFVLYSILGSSGLMLFIISYFIRSRLC